MFAAIYDLLDDVWNGAQTWLFQTLVQPLLLSLGLGDWLEDGYAAVEVFMLGGLQIAAILLLFRPLESIRPAEPWPDRRFVRVDLVYTALNKLGILPLLVFLAVLPLVDALDEWTRALGLMAPSLERLFPSLINEHLAVFLFYFVLYDFAGYWVHRAQHRFRWWWALHSVHHSQRQMSCWSDDRNHVLDDLIVSAVTAVFAALVGVQPEQFVGIILLGKMVESFSHANVRLEFGRIGERLVVGPRFHRLHHALADPSEPRIHDHNYAVVLPVWDILFGTAVFDRRTRPTGVDDAEVDRDNGRSWLGQQIAGFARVGRELARLVSPAR